jgi:hypothetical protein
MDMRTGISLAHESTAIPNVSHSDFRFGIEDITEFPTAQSANHFMFLEPATDEDPLGGTDLAWLWSGFNMTPVTEEQGIRFLHSELFHSGLTFNLPWFLFQGMAKMRSALSGSPSLSQLPGSDSIVANDKRNALIRSIAPSPELGEGEIVKHLVSMVELHFPEKYSGENSLKLNQLLFDLSGRYCDSQVEDFILCFMSNDTLDPEGVDKLLEYIMSQKSKMHLQGFFQMKTPTVEAISVRFLESIARKGTELTLQALVDAGIDKCHLQAIGYNGCCLRQFNINNTV